MGRETAAARLTKHLKPQNVTIYADSNLTRLQARYGLVRDDGGNVDILRRFWTSGELNDCAPSLVVYSDLVATADGRNLEAAQMIHDKYIAPLREQPPELLVEIFTLPEDLLLAVPRTYD
ncbi:MAG: type IV toxin-antitoxin system AbiEi family antitoxin [Pyrinomonadaceae bacterium]